MLSLWDAVPFVLPVFYLLLAVEQATYLQGERLIDRAVGGIQPQEVLRERKLLAAVTRTRMGKHTCMPAHFWECHAGGAPLARLMGCCQLPGLRPCSQGLGSKVHAPKLHWLHGRQYL